MVKEDADPIFDHEDENDKSDSDKDDHESTQEQHKQRQQRQTSYKDMCPNGGPGGLICCEYCSNKYSSFLMQTVEDMEVQKRHKCGKEIKEILTFLQDGRDALELAMGVARTKVPPVPRPMPQPRPTQPPGAAVAASTTFL